MCVSFEIKKHRVFIRPYLCKTVWVYHRRPAHALGAKLWAYWQATLQGPLPTMDLPTDHPRPAVMGSAGDAVAFTLAPALCAALRRLARARGMFLGETCNVRVSSRNRNPRNRNPRTGRFRVSDFRVSAGGRYSLPGFLRG